MNVSMRFVLILAAVTTIRAEVAVRILLGVGDQKQVDYSGEINSRNGRITALEPWRFDGDDKILGADRWRISTHQIRLFGGSIAPQRQWIANGIVAELAGESGDTELSVRTAQGNFTVRLSEIPFGRKVPALTGKALVERIPAFSRITNDAEEQDLPAAATSKSGEVWVAYLEFKHHPDHNKIRVTPNRFDLLALKPGGDQVLVKKWGNGAWSEPIAISQPGGDLWRPAIAVDGQGRPWVFWSSNESGNFEIFARSIENGKPGATVRITNSPGTDMDAVAATDSNGRVWVAWQGWRDGKASIFSAVQNGNSFSGPAMAATSAGNEWNPAIAAGPAGKVTVAWDSYRNGNYDIYLRTASAPNSWGNEMPGAATAAYEAYPSIAYDPKGTLWLAYEEGGERWGKDFGAYASTGFAVYQGRAVRVRGFTADGQVVQTATDVGTALPGVPGEKIEVANRQSDSDEWLKPNPEAAKKRPDARATPNNTAPRNTLPRLTVDASGRIWLAFRSMHPIFWTSVGTVYTEHLTSYSGSEWTPAVYLHHSDNLLDNRPALASVKGGELMVIGSSDGRRLFYPMSYSIGIPDAGEPANDPWQNDLYVNHLQLPAANGIETKAGNPVVVAGPNSGDGMELAAVKTLRAYRLQNGNQKLRAMRGDFHRHSEISMDGGQDGTIIDQYRYMIDAARMDWVGCCDHDNGAGREYTWWISQKLTDLFYTRGAFVPMFNYERSVTYPEGHRNVIFAQRGIRPLPRLKRTDETPVVKAPDTMMLYAYLKKFDGVTASHTSGTNMGTDWRDNDPDSEPAVEIYQGDRQNYEMPGAPRSNSEKDSIGGWRPKGFVNLALEQGYKLAFEASSDHVSTHMSYSIALATDSSREAMLEAFKKRHVYGATDDILAEFHSGGHIMGDAFSSTAAPKFRVKLVGTAAFKKVDVIKNNRYVYTVNPQKKTVEFTWRDMQPDKDKTSYYYVRGEQVDGEIVWLSPMWVTVTGK
jgi:hypothetical protein